MNIEWISGPEDYQIILYYCLPKLEPMDNRVAYCTINGTWNPDPENLDCSVTKCDVMSFTQQKRTYTGKKQY